MLGWTGTTVVPRSVGPMLTSFVSKVYIERQDVFSAFKEVFSHDVTLGLVSPTVLMWKEENVAKCKQIVYSAFKTRVWGLSPTCGNPQCLSIPGNVLFETKKASRDPYHSFARVRCTECGWVTDYLPRPEWIELVPGHHFFMHDYPLPADHHKYFSSRMHPPVAL
jgi:hypothetical protein